jgi:anti-sigma factor RsiW
MHPNELTLSDYIDRTLGRDEQARVARHLETCEACRMLVDDLREITRAASALEPTTPPARLWSRIEKQIGSDRASGANPGPRMTTRAAAASWTWLAAAAVLVLAVFIGVRFAPQMSLDPAATADAAAAEAVEAELKLAEEHYQKAISGLERIASAENSPFDENTASTLQKNLAVINQAIDESRAAVRAEPASQQAQYSLIENFKTKLALLQDTVALINEMRAGNDAAAARIVSGS